MIVRRISCDELYHHGVQGQKWGVQNGPPYPLDSSVSTGQRLKAQKDASKLLRKEINKSKKTIKHGPIIGDTVNVDTKEYAKNIKPYLKDKDLNDMLDLDKQANSLFKKNKKLQELQKKEDDLETQFYIEIDKNGDSKKADELSRLQDKAMDETLKEFERWGKSSDGKKYRELKAQHAKKREEYVKNLLGKYAGKKVDAYTITKYEERLGDLVDRALIELTTEETQMTINPTVFHNKYTRKGQLDRTNHVTRDMH